MEDPARGNDTIDDGQKGSFTLFPILSLPPEILSTILNLLNQFQIYEVRKVSRKFKELVDEHYGFHFNLYDEPSRLSRIKRLKCRKITVWKFTEPLRTNLFEFPSWVREIEIHGVITEQNLKTLLMQHTKIERLSFARRANYPWCLNLRDMPALLSLTNLKTISLNCECRQLPTSGFESLPLMDCFFPSLTTFEIFKSYSDDNYIKFMTCVLGFIGRHHSSLKNLNLNMPSNALRAQDTPVNDGLTIPEDLRKNLAQTRLEQLSIATEGFPKDIQVWKSFLDAQSQLQRLEFEWVRLSNVDHPCRAGFPWRFLERPIRQSCKTISEIKLYNFSLYPADQQQQNGSLIDPMDLALFAQCQKLLTLKLEQTPHLLGEYLPNSPVENTIVNGKELPANLETLRVYGLPIQTSQVTAMIEKCRNLKHISLVSHFGMHRGFGPSPSDFLELGKLPMLAAVHVGPVPETEDWLKIRTAFKPGRGIRGLCNDDILQINTSEGIAQLRQLQI